MIKKLLALAAMSAFLSGCFSSSTSDLEEFVEETKARMPKKLEPLPMIPQVMRLAYDPAGRRNPFDPIPDRTLVLGGIQAGPTPDKNREREYLEQFPLDTMRMVGVLEQQGTRWGLIRAQDGAIHRVSKGAYMGQNHGHITDVKLNEIVLTELIKVGEMYKEQEASLALNDAGK